MQSENRIFDDLARVANGIAGTVAGMSREAGEAFRQRSRDWAGAGEDMVTREEFDAVKAMAAAARDEVELLKARLAALEAGTTDEAR